MAYNDLGFEKQDAGSNISVWGDPHLNNVIDRIRYAIGGYQLVAITGDTVLTSVNGSTVMSDFQARTAMLKFSGTLANNATITVPSTAMRWMFWNATNKVLTVTTGAGVTVTIDPGDRVPVDCDGSNVLTLSYGGLALKDYITAFAASAGAVPSPIGNAGKYLFSDGANVLWRQPSTADLSDYSTKVLGVQIAMARAFARRR
jgi:hypothetical protein